METTFRSSWCRSREHSAIAVAAISFREARLWSRAWKEVRKKLIKPLVAGMDHRQPRRQPGSNQIPEAIQQLVRNNPVCFSFKVTLSNLAEKDLLALSDALRQNRYVEDLWIDSGSGSAFTLMAGEAFGAALRENQSLKVLRIRAVKIPLNPSIAIFEGLQRSTLEELYLERNGIQPGGAMAMGTMLALNQALQVLHIRDNPIRNTGVAAIADGLQHNQTLEELCLQNNSLASGGVTPLGQLLPGNMSLKNLQLVHNHIPNEDVIGLATSLQFNIHLQAWSMTGNPLSGDAVMEIANTLQVSTFLQKLCLWGNSLGNGSTRILATSLRGHQNSVEELRLIKNDISDDGAESLASMLMSPHCVLRVLDLMGNSIERSMPFSNALQQNRTVEDLVLLGNPCDLVRNQDMETCLHRNRAGLRIMSVQENVPHGLFTFVLSRLSYYPDLMFTFLRHAPDVCATREDNDHPMLMEVDDD